MEIGKTRDSNVLAPELGCLTARELGEAYAHRSARTEGLSTHQRTNTYSAKKALAVIIRWPCYIGLN